MSGVIQCVCCPTLTRPARAKTADYDFPTTVRVGGKCEKCYRRGTPPRPRHEHAYNVAGLRSFLARRHAREHAHARADHLHAFLERVNA